MNTSSFNLAGVLAGLIFTAVGMAVIADAYLAWDMAPALLWPALLIAAGATLLVRAATAQSSG